MIRALLVLLATLLPASAETARVLSGEHGDFTRLVIELPAGESWTVGRTPGGYAFAANSDAQPAFETGSVWQRIGRTRLTALEVDPETGALQLTLGCDCHIFPFEYQPGIVVLDITPGPAPEASAFEAAFVPPGQTEASPKEKTATASYDWLATAKTATPPAPQPLPLESGGVSLQPLRDQLLEQIARGAADGVVDMELPGKPKLVAGPEGDAPWSNVRLGEEAGLIVTQPNGLIPEPRPDAHCAAPEELDLSTWGGDKPPHDLLAEAHNDLFQEFDVPDDEAVLHSVRLLLYLGFGAEARQTADILGTSADAGPLPLYRSMAFLIDGDSDPQTPFAGMLECEGPAALWAALAHDRLPPGPGVNRDAILQAFQALPPHLKRQLGPGLAEKFLALDDVEAARIIRDGLKRTPEADPAAVALLDAEAELHGGDADSALTHAATAVELDGDQADSLVALVEASFRKLQPMDPTVAEALQALQDETEGTEEGPAVDRAVVLALALSGQTDAAFAQGAQSGGTEADLWRVVEARATDDDFLRHAILPSEILRPGVEADVAIATARRLLDLGFPDAALVWLGPVSPMDAPELRLVAAAAEGARRNTAAAAELLAGLQGAEAEKLRARVAALGDPQTENARAQGMKEAAHPAPRGEGAAPDAEAQAAWIEAAKFAEPSAVDPSTGLLGRGGKTLDASLASRQAIEALLASVPSPSTP
ncbi:MAG: hypothetical protein U1E58_13020 [Tabrizicola sp.]